MQNDIEILKFEETPEAKHLGVAHIRLFKQVVLRYKVVENKDGSGFFVAPPSYKREFDGQEKWCQWFMLDSQVFGEEVQDMIRAYVNKVMSSRNAPVAQHASTLAQPDQGHQQQTNYAQQAPQAQNQYAQVSSGVESVPF